MLPAQRLNERGQAMIETAILMLLFSTLMAVFLGFSKWFVIRLKILEGARVGALLYSSGHWTRDEVRAQVSRYLTSGFPALQPRRLDVAVGPAPGREGKMLDFDQVTVTYTIHSGWIRFTPLNPQVEETCIIKHAAHYGPSLQTWWGPPVHS